MFIFTPNIYFNAGRFVEENWRAKGSTLWNNVSNSTNNHSLRLTAQLHLSIYTSIAKSSSWSHFSWSFVTQNIHPRVVSLELKMAPSSSLVRFPPPKFSKTQWISSFILKMAVYIFRNTVSPVQKVTKTLKQQHSNNLHFENEMWHSLKRVEFQEMKSKIGVLIIRKSCKDLYSNQNISDE